MRLTLILIATLLFGAHEAAGGQARTTLAGPVVCTECRIELERVVTFGDRDGPGMLQEQSTVAVDGRGRFYVSSNYDPAIIVFDARGRFLQRIGRRGQGPGEFRYQQTIVFGPLDTLYAIDLSGQRMTVFSPSYKFLRTVPLAVSASEVVITHDGRFLFTGATRFADGRSHPFHLLDRNGSHVRAFGAPTGEQDVYSPVGGLRKLAMPRGANVWTSGIHAYVLERWTLEGTRLAELTRQVDWFPPRLLPPRGGGADTQRPAAFIRGVSEDGAGRVWTLLSVADHEWKPREFPMRADGRGRYVPDSLRHKLNDSVLEVIDPARGVVLATRTFDTFFMNFIAPDLVVAFDEDTDGNPRYVVWRVQLVSAARSSPRHD